MKKFYLLNCFFVAILLLSNVTISCYALGYTISFTGAGASTTVESVIVNNLTKGTVVTVPMGSVLNLTDLATSVGDLTVNDTPICIFTNGKNEGATLSFYTRNAGYTQINVYAVNGDKVLASNSMLPKGNNSFELILPKGIYAVHVIGNGYSYKSKLFSERVSQSNISLNYTGNTSLSTLKNAVSGSVDMLYNDGDQLLYKGISGNFVSIVTDKPTSSKTTNFDFVDCTDADGNHYATVKIGTQTWMAENLRTTKYRNNDLIPNVTDKINWSNLISDAQCSDNNTQNVDSILKFGRAYNWYAVSDTRNVAPIGWHVSTENDWLVLNSYVSNVYVSASKSLSSESYWSIASVLNSPGCDLTSNNQTGFSALPGIVRDMNGDFVSSNTTNGYWWSINSSSSQFWRGIDYEDPFLRVIANVNYKKYGMAVRCVRD